MELTDLQKRLDSLTQQNFEDVSIMRSVAADLTVSAYMLEAVHQMLDAIEPRKMQLAQRIAGLVPSPAPAIENQPQDDLPSFMRHVTERVRGYDEPQSDLAAAIVGLRQRAAE
jgi:hypothetical protein